MAESLQDAYVVAATRTAVGKARGMYRNTRPDDLLALVLRSALAQLPDLDPAQVSDVICGCAQPEGEQGLNVARIGALLAGLPQSVPGMTVNRFCASGLQAVALAADRIRTGQADVMIAAGTESMSMVPMMGFHVAMNPDIFNRDENLGIAFGMGLTAEKVAERWKVSRDEQDQFALASHQKAVAAQDAGAFAAEITPHAVLARRPDLGRGMVLETSRDASHDEGPRRDTTLEALAKLRPVFAATGSVTAGNSSQMSDGAAAVVLASERAVSQFKLKPLARFAAFAVAGVPPEIMGIGPKEAIPRALAAAGLRQEQLDWIELNEAFAAQAIAVMRDLALDPTKVNPLGGAIALGHPLGATGAIRTATLVHGLRRSAMRYGMVSMCIGTGMGAAGIFEAIH
jgi:acetyl-CoA acyltransferase